MRSNTKYCLLFLWNGGEQIRAIGLLKELNPEMPTKEAREFMENLAANYGRDKRERERHDREMKAKLNAENPCDTPV